MAYRVSLLDKDKKPLAEGRGICYGFTGKGSCYSPVKSKKLFREYQKELSEYEERGHNVPRFTNAGGKFFRITPEGDGWPSLDWLNLVRSVTCIGFCIDTGEHEYNEGFIDIRLDVPADAVIQVLMTLAAEQRYMAGSLYQSIKDADVPQFLKLVFSLAYSRGSRFNTAAGDSTLFHEMSTGDVKYICDGDRPHECPVTFETARAYPMTVLARWKCLGEGDDFAEFCDEYVTPVSGQIEGHFLSFGVSYIDTPAKAITTIWEKLCQL